MKKYTAAERLWLKNHPDWDEKWVQERIAEDPQILGLGEVILRDKERIQPRAGRLDLLLQDANTNQRYEVEVQLGSTDEAHIIRTIEYWDIERKRYPQYDHTAVIIAEDITSRFLNVISLFNGTLPLVALQLGAFRVGDQTTLIFTKVLDQVTRGLDDEDDALLVTDRDYWLKVAKPETVAIADRLLEMAKELDPHLELKYNKFYIGIANQGKAFNFIFMKPRKSSCELGVKLPRNEETDALIAETGLETLSYDNWGNYRIRLTAKDVDKHRGFIETLMRQAYELRSGN